MANYKTVTRMTDTGPYIEKLILDLGREAGANDLSPAGFHVHVTRYEKDGTILMRKERGADKALPSLGTVTVRVAYPCDAEGRRLLSGCFAALELEEERLNKRIEGSVLASRYIRNAYRVTQIRDLPPREEGGVALSGLVFDTCTEDLCPALEGWTNGENTLRYGAYTPAQANGGEKLPLLVWLHGAGEGGDDPLVAYTGNRVTALSSPEVQTKLGGAAWILVPQCPTVWMDDGREQLSHVNQSIYVKPLKACIDAFVEQHADSIDRDRIWVAGVSNGGFMTIRMLADYPGFFAAAAPGCEAFFEENLTDSVLDAVQQTPLWLTHAKGDELVDPTQTSLPLYRRLKDRGMENLHMTYWDEVVDPTGRYREADGRPRSYFRHGVWILMLDDACRTDLDGSRVLCDGVPVTLWEWMGKQRR
ncbi:prolyl oligopeptidase family serine peptidase [Subdoligranulum variabile]|uniref:Uncharacterized protein n=1 Tax=Subdoligranulum variabile DSM 15176 TaxID=411471 RepID=D1PI95_9FIRM|nr:prolyl oligopeptidase family serine peptidase [Subdoligranulum variabile]EFB77563.1 hypothetical protein SUBVAR_04060 [Subdoligranulum variabile DSM 15176]UWP67168.1 prolyl oligopeptidase family serine peptidase [Subdoligranulum variabile]